MINKFLSAKHWQLFLLTVGVPVLFQFILIGSIILGNSNGEAIMLKYFKLYPLVMMLFGFFYFGWLWSIGVGLDGKIPNDLKLKVVRFKLLFIFPIIYIILFLVFMGNLMNNGIAPNPAIFAIIFPLHLFSMFCILYCLYFVAKTIKTVELQKEVGFGDFAGEFVLIWFFPIGIWFVQPRINKIVEE